MLEWISYFLLCILFGILKFIFRLKVHARNSISTLYISIAGTRKNHYIVMTEGKCYKNTLSAMQKLFRYLSMLQ